MLKFFLMWLLRTLPRKNNANPIHKLFNHDLQISWKKTSLGAQENVYVTNVVIKNRKTKRDRQYKGQTMTYKTLHKKLY